MEYGEGVFDRVLVLAEMNYIKFFSEPLPDLHKNGPIRQVQLSQIFSPLRRGSGNHHRGGGPE